MMRAAVVSLALLLGASSCPTQPTGPAPTVKRCEEDQPCWDCKTMGNKVCGPGEGRVGQA